jgi:hypothetical protein
VANDDSPLAQALGARDDRVGLIERHEHRRAHVPAVDADEPEASASAGRVMCRNQSTNPPWGGPITNVGPPQKSDRQQRDDRARRPGHDRVGHAAVVAGDGADDRSSGAHERGEHRLADPEQELRQEVVPDDVRAEQLVRRVERRLGLVDELEDSSPAGYGASCFASSPVRMIASRRTSAAIPSGRRRNRWSACLHGPRRGTPAYPSPTSAAVSTLVSRKPPVSIL